MNPLKKIPNWRRWPDQVFVVPVGMGYASIFDLLGSDLRICQGCVVGWRHGSLILCGTGLLGGAIAAVLDTLRDGEPRTRLRDLRPVRRLRVRIRQWLEHRRWRRAQRREPRNLPPGVGYVLRDGDGIGWKTQPVRFYQGKTMDDDPHVRVTVDECRAILERMQNSGEWAAFRRQLNMRDTGTPPAAEE